MAILGKSPLAWLEFDERGALKDPHAGEHLGDLVRAAGTKDLVVLSHGWKNDRDDATRLYGELWQHTCDALRRRDPEAMAVCGILWPAKTYETDFDEASIAAAAGGHAMSTRRGAAVRDLTEAEFSARLASFETFVGPSASKVVAAARPTSAGIDGRRARALVEASRRVVATPAQERDCELLADARPFLADVDAQRLVAGLAEPPTRRIETGVGGAKGLDEVVGTVFQGPRAAVARFLNQLTYFEMKKRAGVVGAALGSNVLGAVEPRHPTPVRLHLVGHSFGARLVTAAASRLPRTMPLDFFSLTLLQGAFSHNAMAKVVEPGVSGAFPDVVGRPAGPIAVTHTHNDLACTLAYALASRLSWDKASAIGDKDDVFGAMGANGPQKLPAESLAKDHSSGPFLPAKGKVNRFLADAYVVKTDVIDAHNNVANAQVGKLLAAVLDA